MVPSDGYMIPEPHGPISRVNRSSTSAISFNAMIGTA